MDTTPLTPSAETAGGAERHSGPSRRPWLIGGTAIVVLLGLGLAGLLWPGPASAPLPGSAPEQGTLIEQCEDLVRGSMMSPVDVQFSSSVSRESPSVWMVNGSVTGFSTGGAVRYSEYQCTITVTAGIPRAELDYFG